MSQLNYKNGQIRLEFDTEVFDFRQMLLDHLSAFSVSQGGGVIDDLENIHNAPGITENVEVYRQQCFSLFRTSKFQLLFRKFGKMLIETHFDGVGIIQKTPTVRIQLPGARSTSYHSDGWYGHGATVRSFWLPLTSVGDGNTLYMAHDIDASRRCLERIMSQKMTLAQINMEGQEECRPFEGHFGDLLSFTSEMMHGAKKNSWDSSRVSFDFRIAPDETDIGSKPRSNFVSYEEICSGMDGLVESGTSKKYRAVTYSNLCSGKSAKAQLMLCASYAEANSIDIVGNESEIVTLPYMPVMREYLRNELDTIDSIVVFGVEVFNGDRNLASEILECADNGGKIIFFCAEGIHYEPGADKLAVLSLV